MSSVKILAVLLLSTVFYMSSATAWLRPEHANSRNFCAACGDFSRSDGVVDAAKYVINSAFADNAYPVFYAPSGTRFQYTPFQWMNSNGAQVRLENGVGQRVLVRWEMSLLSGFKVMIGSDVHMAFLIINEVTGVVKPIVVLARRYSLLQLSDPFRDESGNFFDENWSEEYVGYGYGYGYGDGTGVRGAYASFPSLTTSGRTGTVSIGPDYLNPEAEATGY